MWAFGIDGLAGGRGDGIISLFRGLEETEKSIYVQRTDEQE